MKSEFRECLIKPKELLRVDLYMLLSIWDTKAVGGKWVTVAQNNSLRTAEKNSSSHSLPSNEVLLKLRGHLKVELYLSETLGDFVQFGGTRPINSKLWA